jgi:hypothetical protein
MNGAVGRVRSAPCGTSWGAGSRKARKWISRRSTRSVALYDKLHISHDGYAGAVPIIHKSAAVSEVIAQLAVDGDDDPE